MWISRFARWQLIWKLKMQRHNIKTYLLVFFSVNPSSVLYFAEPLSSKTFEDLSSEVLNSVSFKQMSVLILESSFLDSLSLFKLLLGQTESLFVFSVRSCPLWRSCEEFLRDFLRLDLRSSDSELDPELSRWEVDRKWSCFREEEDREIRGEFARSPVRTLSVRLCSPDRWDLLLLRLFSCVGELEGDRWWRLERLLLE